jgi:hypothetical protein
MRIRSVSGPRPIDPQALDAYGAGMSKKAIQYTLRDVSPTMDKAVRQRAKMLGESINHVALDALARGAGVHGTPARVHDDLDAFFGSWVEDAEVDRALGAQRRVDRKTWA